MKSKLVIAAVLIAVSASCTPIHSVAMNGNGSTGSHRHSSSYTPRGSSGERTEEVSIIKNWRQGIQETGGLVGDVQDAFGKFRRN